MWTNQFRRTEDKETATSFHPTKERELATCRLGIQTLLWRDPAIIKWTQFNLHINRPAITNLLLRPANSWVNEIGQPAYELIEAMFLSSVSWWITARLEGDFCWLRPVLWRCWLDNRKGIWSTNYESTASRSHEASARIVYIHARRSHCTYFDFAVGNLHERLHPCMHIQLHRWTEKSRIYSLRPANCMDGALKMYHLLPKVLAQNNKGVLTCLESEFKCKSLQQWLPFACHLQKNDVKSYITRDQRIWTKGYTVGKKTAPESRRSSNQ